MSTPANDYRFDRDSSGHHGPVMPQRRDLHFLPPAGRIGDWHVAGPNATQFMNALSLLFPAGERMFIDAVRSYRDDIPDPDLKKAATAFIGQEAMHSREHIGYNQLMEEAGLPANKLDTFTWDPLDIIQHKTPKSTPLAATIAREHYTALMGDMLLRHPEQLAGSQEDYARMWRWHALEEIEHKAVAYDVYEQCIGRGPRNWLERSGAMIVATGLFWPIVFAFYWQMSRADPKCRAAGWRGHLKMLNFTFGRPG
ncbi:metal-dependent hydrolase [Salinisphaera sp. LB1]|uniref:metal-dependent hydrolase n=1 Tax=Salinisphaera sp. LB1 TaxID=2183911 RepID=UPI000D7E4158|nr:metal-dependent hydrolase [Salinisphaera sp. LB1]AWN14588.1 hypothetical protein SALB1_0381 [Salinisphaera sp. LB1]